MATVKHHTQITGPDHGQDVSANAWDEDHDVTLVDADIPASIARDAEVTTAVGTHAGASDPHGDRAAATAGLSAHAAASDPHPGYLTPAEANAAYDASGAASAAVAAEATARNTAIGVHSADTTSVHGIADTSALVLTGDSRLSDSRAPSGTAGGDLSGSYPNPSVVDDSHSHTAATLPGSSGAPTDADYLVGTAQGGLSAEIVVGTSPGGELGGTWASPTVDATHSGSTHAATQAAAEATAATALTAHLNDTVDAHDASAISFSPTGTIAATDVQAAIAEVAAEAASGSAGVDPIFDKFGAPDTAFEFETSSLAGLTALSTTPDVVDADTTVPGAYFLRDDASGVVLVGHYTPATAPFTAICRVLGTTIRGNYNRVGMFIGEATPGKLVMQGFLNHDHHNAVLKMANPTDGSASELANDGEALQYLGLPLYLAIRANSNSSVDYAFSEGGYIWTRGPVAGHNPSMTIGSVGLGMLALDAVYGLSAAWDFLRIWNSAKTLPGF